MPNRIAIACAGLHAGVLIETLSLSAECEITLFDDAADAWGTSRFGRFIAGPLREIEVWVAEGRIDRAMIGTANVRRLHWRLRVFELLKNAGLPLATAVHPSSFVSPSAEIGEGTFIAPMSVVHSQTIVGRNACVYTGSTIDHDNVLEDHVFISPGVHTSGKVTIECGAYLGPGCIVAGGCRVGADSVIGAGAVVLSDIPPRSVAIGTPAIVVKSLDEWLATA